MKNTTIKLIMIGVIVAAVTIPAVVASPKPIRVAIGITPVFIGGLFLAKYALEMRQEVFKRLHEDRQVLCKRGLAIIEAVKKENAKRAIRERQEG